MPAPRNQARNLKKIDIELFGLDPARDAEFDEYLTAMEKTAVAISRACRSTISKLFIARPRFISRQALRKLVM